MKQEDSLQSYYEILTPEQATRLLQRQQLLQDEAQMVLAELDLIHVLNGAGTLRLHGSAVTGLMVWRDIDMGVSSLHMNSDHVFDIMRPLYTHPRVKQVRYLNESGSYNLTRLAKYERFYFGIYYKAQNGNEWKIDISFWLAEGIHAEPVHEAIMQQSTPETRLAILWIKDVWYQLPTYRTEVYSTDIYDAVFQHGVHTPLEFNHYLAEHGKPTEPGMDIATADALEQRQAVP